MSLADNLEDIMKQTSDYREEAPGGKSSEQSAKDVEKINEEILGGADATPNNKKKRENPFKHKDDEDGGSNRKKFLIAIGGMLGVALLVGGLYAAYTYATRDRGTDWMQEVEENPAPAFQYSIEEREVLRANGYTADDIERFEVEERDPVQLVEEAKAARKAVYDEEIKPYLDGASPKFNELKELTWLGTGEMSSTILSSEEGQYEQRLGAYNCDYKKIPAYGSQLFVKLTLMDFDGKEIFMTVTPDRYNELSDTGNIVVTIDYYLYSDGSILVHDVFEKDISD